MSITIYRRDGTVASSLRTPPICGRPSYNARVADLEGAWWHGGCAYYAPVGGVVA